MYLQLTLVGADVSIKPRGEIRIGETSVTIASDIAKPNSAFIICGSDLCRLELNESKSTPVSISSVWFTDRNEVELTSFSENSSPLMGY
jgi:hypothetical protein